MDVLDLLQEGDISGMPIAGHWRIRADSGKEFLREGLRSENLRTIERAVNDPTHWARVLREFPDMATTLEQAQHPPNSLGAFLKDTLKLPWGDSIIAKIQEGLQRARMSSSF